MAAVQVSSKKLYAEDASGYNPSKSVKVDQTQVKRNSNPSTPTGGQQAVRSDKSSSDKKDTGVKTKSSLWQRAKGKKPPNEGQMKSPKVQQKKGHMDISGNDDIPYDDQDVGEEQDQNSNDQQNDVDDVNENNDCNEQEEIARIEEEAADENAMNQKSKWA